MLRIYAEALDRFCVRFNMWLVYNYHNLSQTSLVVNTIDVKSVEIKM